MKPQKQARGQKRQFLLNLQIFFCNNKNRPTGELTN